MRATVQDVITQQQFTGIVVQTHFDPRFALNLRIESVCPYAMNHCCSTTQRQQTISLQPSFLGKTGDIMVVYNRTLRHQNGARRQHSMAHIFDRRRRGASLPWRFPPSIRVSTCHAADCFDHTGHRRLLPASPGCVPEGLVEGVGFRRQLRLVHKVDGAAADQLRAEWRDHGRIEITHNHS
jgi:hypothetical protein